MLFCWEQDGLCQKPSYIVLIYRGNHESKWCCHFWLELWSGKYTLMAYLHTFPRSLVTLSRLLVMWLTICAAGSVGSWLILVTWIIQICSVKWFVQTFCSWIIQAYGRALTALFLLRIHCPSLSVIALKQPRMYHITTNGSFQEVIQCTSFLQIILS